MPKKKLTKAQVKRLLNSANASIYKLAIDRLNHSTQSMVPITFNKLEIMLKDIGRAFGKL